MRVVENLRRGGILGVKSLTAVFGECVLDVTAAIWRAKRRNGGHVGEVVSIYQYGQWSYKQTFNTCPNTLASFHLPKPLYSLIYGRCKR